MVSDLERRVKLLQERIAREHGPGSMLFCSVVCNGCGRTVVALGVRQLADKTRNWRIGTESEAVDYCLDCVVFSPRKEG